MVVLRSEFTSFLNCEINWNIRGLNNPLKQKVVASFVCLHKLCLFGLVETKMRAENLVSAVKFSFPKH